MCVSLSWRLERLYYNCDYRAVMRLNSAILKADPQHTDCLPIHVALLVELKKTSDLFRFRISHSIVDPFPRLVCALVCSG